jgi:hypothetical protein
LADGTLQLWAIGTECRQVVGSMTRRRECVHIDTLFYVPVAINALNFKTAARASDGRSFLWHG